MPMNMIIFEYREVETEFFRDKKFDNFDISFYKEPLTPEFVRTLPQDVLENTNIISVFINSVVDEEVINAFKNLRIISTRSTGYDHINLNVCKDKNIAVVNVENYGSTSVAQYTLGLMIMLVRKIFPAGMSLYDCKNYESFYNGRDLSKLTLGVAGTGAIGAAVCRLAKCLNMNIIAYDVVQKRELEEDIGLKYVEFDELLKKSDIITLHMPYTGNNYHMFSDTQFDMMKQGVYFINTSRGEILDIGALYKNVESGKVQGAALDVLTCESISFSCDKFAERIKPLPLVCANEVKLVEKLSHFKNVIITPHIAYDTQDSVDYILDVTMRSISDVVYGGKMSRVV